MIRELCCALVCMVTLAPAAAQSSFQLMDRSAPSMHVEASGLSKIATPMPAATHDAVDASSAYATRAITIGQRVGTLASTVFQALAAQNARAMVVPAHQEMDAYLRPPDGTSDNEETLFRQAKKLYDGVTTYRTSRYDFSIDPLSLRCELKLSLSTLLSGGSK